MKAPGFLWILLGLLAIASPADEITPSGQALSNYLDGLDVKNRWQSGVKVDWQTGLSKEGTPPGQDPLQRIRREHHPLLRTPD